MYGPATLPKSAEEVLNTFVTESDRRVLSHLPAENLADDDLRRLSRLWSMAQLCLDTSYLTVALQAAGFDAKNVYNEQAFEKRTLAVSSAFEITSRTAHLVTRLQYENKKYYIDPYWQQFMCDDFGVSIDEIYSHRQYSLQPSERVLCYKEEQLQTVVNGYVCVMQTMQNRAIRHPGSVSDMFTRTEPSLLEQMLGGHRPRPVKQYAQAELATIATQVWNPKNYRIIDTEELACLKTPPQPAEV